MKVWPGQGCLTPSIDDGVIMVSTTAERKNEVLNINIIVIATYSFTKKVSQQKTKAVYILNQYDEQTATLEYSRWR